MMKTLNVVTAIVERDGKILLAQRPLHADQSGAWEFAGDKVEPDESQPETLIRELREELSIEAVVGRCITNHQRGVSDRSIHLYAWHVPSYQRELRAHGHRDIVWCSPEEALHRPLIPADILLLEAFILLRAAGPADSC